MHKEDPSGFIKRHPAAKKIPRVPLTSAGPNAEWCGDGHDKLNSRGVGLYGIHDKASGKWLGLWASPTNRDGKTAGNLYLSLVEKLRGKLLLFYRLHRLFISHLNLRHSSSVND